MDEPVDALRTLDWATMWADHCEQRFGNRLCDGCVAQGRARCALADYARRLIAVRYGRASAAPPSRGDDAGSELSERC